MAEHRCRKLGAPTLKSLVLGWIKPPQKNTLKKDRQLATMEPNPASLQVKNRWHAIFPFFVFIDVVNQYSAWYTSTSCNWFRIAALNHTTLTRYTSIVCVWWKRTLCRRSLQPLSSLFKSIFGGCLSFIICRQTMQSLFCQNNTDNWENAVCACRNVNHSLFYVAPCLNLLSHVLFWARESTLEQGCSCLALCVLSGEKGCDKARLLLSEVLPCLHTPHYWVTCLLLVLSFLSCFLIFGRGSGQNKSWVPLSKG